MKPSNDDGPAGRCRDGASPSAWIWRAGRSWGAGIWAVFLALAQVMTGVDRARAEINPPGCNASGLGIVLFADKQLARVGDTINYTFQIYNRPFPSCLASELVATVKTPDGAVNNITLRRVALQPDQSDTYTNVVKYVIRQQDVQSDGTLKASAEAAGSIHQNVINSRGEAFQSLNTIVVQPCIEVAHTCQGGVGENAPITFSGTVKNCHNFDLSGVVVSNFVNGVAVRVFGPATLTAGQSATFSGSYIPVCGANTQTVVATGNDLTGRPVSASSQSTCQNTLTPGIKLAVVCPTGTPTPGVNVVYAGTVSNTGNVTLTNVVVNNGAAQVFTVATLAPGASQNFTVPVPAPADACQVSVSLTATGRDRCNGVAVNDAASATCPVGTTPQIAVTHDCPPTITAVGQTGTYRGTVRNTGNVSLANVEVRSGNVVIFRPTDGRLAPGQSAEFSGSFSALPDTCSVTTTVTAAGSDICGNRPVSATSTKVCPIATTPGIELTAECPSGVIAPGGSALYAGKVSNTGNVTLTDVVVNNAAGTRVFGPITLAPGASADYTASVAVPQGVCAITTSFTATGKDKCSAAVVSKSASRTCPVLSAGQIKVTVVCSGTSAAPGGTVAYTGTVTNPGNGSLTNVVVTSGGKVVFGPATLAAGASANYSGSTTAPADACLVAVTVVASAADSCGGNSLTDTASATCPIATTPAIVVTHDCPATAPVPGATANFAGSVRNSGNVTLTNVVVVSGGATIFGPATLTPNQSANFTGSYTVPADVCAVSTTVTASAADVCGARVVNSTSTKSCPVLVTPKVEVAKSCPPTPATPGGTIVYAGTVSNSGNVTLTDVVVVSSVGNTRVFGPISLAPGASSNFTASVKVPANVCSVTDSFTVTAKDKCNAATVSNSATTTCPVLTDGKIAVTVVCGPGTANPGGAVAFNGTVSNPGNVTLTNVVVVQGEREVFRVATLAPGASAKYSGTVTAPANTCSVTVAVVASAADACGGTGLSQTASATCPITTTPALDVSLACGTAAAPGKVATFTGVVRNSGNISLSNVVVLHSRAGTAPVIGPIALAPGESANFSGSYIVPTNAAACKVASTVTATGADVCQARAVRKEASAECPVITTPRLVVTRTCPANAVAQGGRLEYTGTVVNTGDVTLTDIVVTDNQPAPGTKVTTINSLAPGQSASFKGSFVVPKNCCTVSATLTAVGKDACSGVSVRDTGTTTCPVLFTPAIAVTKTCEGDPAEVGETLRFKGTVKNTGNITLVNVEVMNTHGDKTTKVLGPINLVPGEFVTFHGSYVVPDDFCGDDLTVATGKSLCGDKDVSAQVRSACPVITFPSLQITKHCPTSPVLAGGNYAYTATVRNNGNVTMTNIVVTNTKPTANTKVATIPSLAPGQSVIINGNYNIAHDCCEIVDTLIVVGNSRCDGRPCTHSSTAVCPVAMNPALSVSKRCNIMIGSPMFGGSVTNTGDVLLRDVRVVSVSAGVETLLLGPIELAPGEVAEFLSGADLTTSDTDVVIARGKDLCRGMEVAAAANCAGAVNLGGGGTESSQPVIEGISSAQGVVTLRWSAQAGSKYRLQFKAGTMDGAWQNAGDVITADGKSVIQSHNAGDAACAIYRVVVVK